MPQSKSKLWHEFVAAHNIASQCVPLFDTTGDKVTEFLYGRESHRRLVLKRSDPMEGLMRGLGRKLMKQHSEGQVTHDGILYMMLTQAEDELVPLYIGKAETFGKSDRNLSANISDLAKNGQGKFGRWGYNYAYHFGDLSAVTCEGHPKSKATSKYRDWRDSLFVLNDSGVYLKKPVLFWATLWGPECQSIWKQYGSTKLAFEEYLVIGVASDVFPDSLLNREGRTR